MLGVGDRFHQPFASQSPSCAGSVQGCTSGHSSDTAHSSSDHCIHTVWAPHHPQLHNPIIYVPTEIP